MSDEYDDLTAANFDVLVQLKQITRRLHDLSNQVERVSNAIDEAEDYSYQYNVKIIGLKQVLFALTCFDKRELKFLLKASILPIAYRRGVKEMVPNLSFVNLKGVWRNGKFWKFERLKLTPQVSVNLLILSSEAYESLIILLPKSRSYSLKTRS